ncbi:MAG: Tex-like N-terminal domain-containing protein [Planctomycetota bacterium]
MVDKALQDIAKDYRLNVDQVRQLFKLLGGGYNPTYLLRYHKDLTANLDYEQLHELMEHKARLDRLDKKREKIRGKLRDLDVLSEELDEKLTEATSFKELMDHYVPYRPRKQSRSRQALGQGLGELARELLSQERFASEVGKIADEYVDPDKGLEDRRDVLEGTAAIICDWVAEEKTHRDRQRKTLRSSGRLVAKKAKDNLPGRVAGEFKDYFGFSTGIDSLHPYQMLRIQRGKRLDALEYEIQPPLKKMCLAAAELYLEGGPSEFKRTMSGLPDSMATLEGEDLPELTSTEFLCLCLQKGLEDILAPVLVRELDRDLSRKAEAVGLRILRQELRTLLMTRPLPGKRVMGIKGGYRTGCKLAILDEDGQPIATDIMYPHTPRYEIEESKETLAELVDEHEIDHIAIGAGTASQETESVVSDVIDESQPELDYALVPEAGIDAYASGGAGKHELPDYSEDYRASVSIARRLRDPLKELAKINPLDLCTTEYHRDVDRKRLQHELNQVVENNLCTVGIDLNSDGRQLMNYITGLNPEITAEIDQYRRENNGFSSREELKDVSSIGPRLYRKIACFFKVPGSDNPLDHTRIHPDYYPLAEKICEEMSIDADKLGTEEGKEQVKDRRNELDLSELEKEFGVHYLVLKGIMDEMQEPWPDERLERGQKPVLRQGQKDFDDLEPGQTVVGLVRNVVDFGVFVDIGVGEDGLIHVSELADRFVHNPYEVVSVGQRVEPTVLEVSAERGKIALSLKSEPLKDRKRKEKKKKRKRTARATAGKAEDVPDKKPSKIEQAPQSTIGSESRRVERAKRAKVNKPPSKTEEQILKPTQKAQEAKEKEETGEESEEQPTKDKEEAETRTDLLDKLKFGTDVEQRGKPSD